MNRSHCLAPLSLAALAAFATLSGCHSAADLGHAEVSAAVTGYLARRGDLCLAKTAWPIVVTQREAAIGSRNALQMPVLERLGLVASEPARVALPEEQGGGLVDARRYRLTDAGQRDYRARDAGGGVPDLCAARLRLDKVVGWKDAPGAGNANGGAPAPRHVVVSYTYQVDAAPWTRDPDIAKVFPMVDRVLRGAGTAQLQEGFTLTERGWVASGS